MTLKQEISAADWDVLIRAPMMVALYIIVAGRTSAGQIMSEVTAVSNALVNTAIAPQPVALIVDVAPEARDLFNREVKNFNLHQPKMIREATQAVLKQTMEILKRTAPPVEQAAFCHWLAWIAKVTAESAREGTFLGMGGVSVSGDEILSLRELDAMLSTSVAAQAG